MSTSLQHPPEGTTFVFDCHHKDKNAPKDRHPLAGNKYWYYTGLCRPCDGQAGQETINKIDDIHQRELEECDRKAEEAQVSPTNEELDKTHMKPSTTMKVEQKFAELRIKLKDRRDQVVTNIHTAFQKKWNTDLSNL